MNESLLNCTAGVDEELRGVVCKHDVVERRAVGWSVDLRSVVRECVLRCIANH